MASLSDQPRLQCGIIGAGIAGLSAAIALTKAGHDVDVYEKSQFKNEVGAAIGIQPNATYILRRWGFDFAAAMQTITHGIRVLDAVTGAEQDFISFEENRECFGDDMTSFHRADLHAQLRSVAVDNGATLHIANGVADVDPESGNITFRNGDVVTKDLVVVASGIHNEWVEKITGETSLPHTLGCLYRLLCPLERVLAVPEARKLYEYDRPVITEVWDKDTLVFTYPCRKGSLLNVVIARPRTWVGANVSADDWHIEVSKKDVLDAVEDCHPGFATLVDTAERISAYPSSYRQPIKRMNKGKLVLVGDAAHAMMPSLGQGAGMAIEDAAALEALFSHWRPSRQTVETRLGLFNNLRHPRATVVQIISNGLKFVPMEILRQDCEKYLPTGPFHPLEADHFSLPSRRYLYNHNVYEQAAKVMEFDNAEDVPDGVVQYFQEVSAEA